ncbi:hypothetical protein HOY82DRAFT_6434 [Tuber indicum]|nr:hypothetical protein HOY82DRAFT_6434 [Tuber indicum]
MIHHPNAHDLQVPALTRDLPPRIQLPGKKRKQNHFPFLPFPFPQLFPHTHTIREEKKEEEKKQPLSETLRGADQKAPHSHIMFFFYGGKKDPPTHFIFLISRSSLIPSFDRVPAYGSFFFRIHHDVRERGKTGARGETSMVKVKHQESITNMRNHGRICVLVTDFFSSFLSFLLSLLETKQPAGGRQTIVPQSVNRCFCQPTKQLYSTVV